MENTNNNREALPWTVLRIIKIYTTTFIQKKCYVLR